MGISARVVKTPDGWERVYWWEDLQVWMVEREAAASCVLDLR